MNRMKSSESLTGSSNSIFGKKAKNLFDNFKDTLLKIQTENGIETLKEKEYRKMDSLFENHSISQELINDEVIF